MTDLFVRTEGNRNAELSLLFMHGGMGLDHSYFRPFVDPLGDFFELTFYDHRGNGRSARVAPDAVNLDVLSEDAINVAEKTGARRIVLVAHSFAAWIALAVSGRRPSWLAGIVLVSPALSSTLGATLVDYIGKQGRPELQRLVADALGGQLFTDALFADTWQQLLPLYLVCNPREQAKNILSNSHLSPEGFQQFLVNAFGRLDCEQAVRGLHDVPLLVVAGVEDWLETDTDGSASVAQLASTARYVALEQCGHFPFADQPQRFCEIVRQWISEVLTDSSSATTNS